MGENSSEIVNSKKNSMVKSIVDLDIDSLAHCARFMNIDDILNMASSCKFLKFASYTDSFWLHLFREKWPEQMLGRYVPGIPARESFLNWRLAVQKFSFVDPLVLDCYTDGRPFSHVLLRKNSIVFAQGPLIRVLKIDDLIHGRHRVVDSKDHKARITCMRLFPYEEASVFGSTTQEDNNLLVTSSSDHCIRLWWKDSCVRCLRGHSGPVSTLSDKLLGDSGKQVLASGGEDGTVRLWSLSSNGKRGKYAPSATLHGHYKQVKLLSVSGHKTSLLVSVAADSKVRVWDSSMGSSFETANCVGTTSASGGPVGIKCFESMLYLAAGSSVHAIDLRTMKKAFIAAACQSNISSFEMLPSRSLVCTGVNDRALLWDIRKSQDGLKPEPMEIMGGHKGPVTQIHMDPYKIVTGGQHDFCANVWNVETGDLRTSLICSNAERPDATGCNAMSVRGSRMVSVSNGNAGLLRFIDFSNAFRSINSYEEGGPSKFWNTKSYSDSDCDE